MLKGLLKTMRPHQWVKNLFVVAPLIFAQGLENPQLVMRSVAAFFLFSMAASAVYVLNDLADVEADRAHPTKRNRPIAAGQVSERHARVATGTLAMIALGGGLAMSWQVAAALGSYLVLQLAYTFKLKRVPYLDVFSIALGFELRVLTGTFALDVPPTVYLLVVTFLLSLFLGFGKRMHELKQGGAKKQRAVLAAYSESKLMFLLQLTALATTGTYVIYTLDPHTRETFGTDYLAATIVFTEFGILRFFELVRNETDADSPTEQMLRDKPFLLNLVLWAIAVVVVIYAT